MEITKLNRLMLNTVFSCMACDGDIDLKEVQFIKELHRESNVFGDINLEDEMDTLYREIKDNPKQFIRNYFSNLSAAQLKPEEELKLIEVAIATIKADNKIEYSEVKFFKVIRSKLKIDDDQILGQHPDFEDYLQRDIISESYLAGLMDDFMNLGTFTASNFEDLDLKSLIQDGDGDS